MDTWRGQLQSPMCRGRAYKEKCRGAEEVGSRLVQVPRSHSSSGLSPLHWPNVWNAIGASENPLSEGALHTTFNVVTTKVEILANDYVGVVVFVLATISRRGSILILTHNLSPALIL